ncbi:hypothetical protein LMG29542_07724 [Paraburkholderia humisilvae]|uniref:Uncharacterized protein n=1 Tax=Paraburkholderia humisilvae TaxID=627669 RepID=A0A6J5F6A6_9BURK|nr:hypothetical protein LMG29542_07724 [Paraburkholderia humisilvae]
MTLVSFLRNSPLHTADQQGMLVLHRMRLGFVEERTSLVNCLRGLLAKFWRVSTTGHSQVPLRVGRSCRGRRERDCGADTSCIDACMDEVA